jgi:hypothetical protein
MTAGQRVDDIKASIPGTQAYEARHGYDKAHANMQNLKAHIPGTNEHNNRATGVGATGMGGNTGMAGTGMGAHTGTGMGGNPATAGMTTGEKVMSAVPGTVENQEKRMAQGNMAGTGAYDQQGMGMGAPTGHVHHHRHGL